MPRIGKDVLLMMWVSVVAEAAALLWPLFFTDPFPLPGLRQFHTLPHAPALLALSVLVTLWLSVSRWHTRQRMIRFSWIIGAVGFHGAMVVGFFFGCPLCAAAGEAWRAARDQGTNTAEVSG